MSQNNIQSDSVQNPRVTWEGCSVLLDINDGDRLVFARLTAGSTLKIGKKKYSLRPLIGCPFGSSFQIENGTEGPYLSRFIPSTEGRVRKVTRLLKLSLPTVQPFEKKTAFSQEKYRIKKQKKYAPRVLLRRPSARSICEAYFKKYPNRIGFLRVDALSLLLSLANVSANSDILLVDMFGGLLTGAVAERLGGTGCVCNTYLGSTPSPVEIVRTFNFNNEICKRIVRAPLHDLCSDQTGTKKIDSCNAELNVQISTISIEEMPLPSKHEAADSQTIVSPQSKMGKAPKAGEKASEEALKSWKENGFSSLIIAAPDADAWNLVKVLLPLLSYSAPFAIYHQYLQPLATCMHNLQQSKMAIGMQISEPWLREYQFQVRNFWEK
ncbi:hypothetical protein BDE02_05G202800 [Populus trichocarpa]|nr:hypothetical protein BDE02_05G202800 [Populus trichocarpa]